VLFLLSGWALFLPATTEDQELEPNTNGAIVELSSVDAYGLARAQSTDNPADESRDFLDKVLYGYHDYQALTSRLQEFAVAYPDIVRLFSLGRSVRNREIWALEITDNPDTEEDEPEFKYVSTLHGDEAIGTELTLKFAELLLVEYGRNERVTTLVDSTDIWIVPLMNPDGHEFGVRLNALLFDLNRSFPVYPFDYQTTQFDGEPLHDAWRPPEVRHVMRWSAANSFVLSASFHSGGLGVRYPYDNDVGVDSGERYKRRFRSVAAKGRSRSAAPLIDFRGFEALSLGSPREETRSVSRYGAMDEDPPDGGA
jgi:hypothetical protein